MTAEGQEQAYGRGGFGSKIKNFFVSGKKKNFVLWQNTHNMKLIILTILLSVQRH